MTLTVPTADAGSFGYRQFVELFDSDGKRIDIFRVSEVPKKTYAPDGMMRMTCDQALCTLKDGLVPGYHQFGGTTQNLRGAIESVLGIPPEQSIESFLGGLAGRYRFADGPCKAQGCIFTLDSDTGLCTAVERVDIR